DGQVICRTRSHAEHFTQYRFPVPALGSYTISIYVGMMYTAGFNTTVNQNATAFVEPDPDYGYLPDYWIPEPTPDWYISSAVNVKNNHVQRSDGDCLNFKNNQAF
ncbi:hypothetical protein PMAYCL1PPCAC_21340, partial [Pristionchus mayeri]